MLKKIGRYITRCLTELIETGITVLQTKQNYDELTYVKDKEMLDMIENFPSCEEDDISINKLYRVVTKEVATYTWDMWAASEEEAKSCILDNRIYPREVLSLVQEESNTEIVSIEEAGPKREE